MKLKDPYELEICNDEVKIPIRFINVLINYNHFSNFNNVLIYICSRHSYDYIIFHVYPLGRHELKIDTLKHGLLILTDKRIVLFNYKVRYTPTMCKAY